jgi:hypothetical protein
MSPRNVNSYLPDNTTNLPAGRKFKRRFTKQIGTIVSGEAAASIIRVESSQSSILS